MSQIQEPVCKRCNGSGNIIIPEADEYIDCRCTDDKWDAFYQDKCTMCEGKGWYSWKNMDGTFDEMEECVYCNCGVVEDD